MNYNGNQTGNYTVSRILRISPEQNEMVRRNHSRIFIMPVGEGFIDSVIFQGYRPLEGYLDVAKRAAALAGLVDISGVSEMRPVHSPVGAGFLQSHIATVGWLEANDKTVYDLVVEVIPEDENLPNIDFPTQNAVMVDDYLDNPVIISVETKNLVESYDDMAGTNVGSIRSPAVEPQATEQPNEGQLQEAATPGQRGRVKDPSTDRRLKKNRDGSSTAMARQATPSMDDRSHGDAGRMAGRPGRVRHSIFDGRLKGNRRATSQPQQGAVATGTGGR